MPEPLNALAAQVAAQSRALDECRRERDVALSALQSIVDITEETSPPAPECDIREVAIQAIAHALEDACHD